MSNWNNYLWTEEVAYDITFYPPMQYWVLTPDTIHTWAHLALAMYMMATWVSDPHMALTSLKLRAQMCP